MHIAQLWLFRTAPAKLAALRIVEALAALGCRLEAVHSSVGVGNSEEALMRSFLIALVFAAGFGLAGTSTTMAAPTNSKAIAEIGKSQSVIQDVRCRRYCNRYRCWRRCWW
jgi:hypothetical protein